MEQQEELIQKLRNRLPHNLIIVGPKYSGKKTLISEITNDFYYVENNVEAIRSLDSKGDYIFTDIDEWSPACFSAMLKLLEENDKYHMILTCKNIMNIPRSIQSRCHIERMEPYLNICNYCDSIGQLQFYSNDMLLDIDKFEYKDEYDLDVYFTVLCNRLLYRIKNGEYELTKNYLISSKYNSSKHLKSLNKKQFVLSWQLDMKGATNEWTRL